MDPEFKNLLTEILGIAVVVVLLFGRGLFRLLKSLVPNPQAPQGKPKKAQMMDFLDELRRDLGHDDAPPKGDRLLEEEPGGLMDAEEPIPQVPRERDIEQPAERQRPRPVRRPTRSTRVRKDREAPKRERPAFLETAMASGRVKPPAVIATSVPPVVPEEDFLGIHQLLSTDLQRAIILREILGPPRAHRRHHRRF